MQFLFDFSAQFFDGGNSTVNPFLFGGGGITDGSCALEPSWHGFLSPSVLNAYVHVLHHLFKMLECILSWGQRHCCCACTCFMCFCVPACVFACVCVFFFFTHSVAVHEEDPEWLSTVIFQTEEEGVMSIEVMASLQGEKTQGDRGMKGHIGKRCEEAGGTWET